MRFLPTASGPWFVAVALVLGAATAAHAVSPVGAQFRIDVDPKAPFYEIGSYVTTATLTGGFAVAWPEDSLADPNDYFEAIRYRVFGANLKPVAAPGSANIAGHRDPSIRTFFSPADAKSLYLVFNTTRTVGGSPRSEIFGQAIGIKTAAAGVRSLLNTTPNKGSVQVGLTGLKDGRLVFAWSDDGNSKPIPARFISAARSPQAVSLDLKQSGNTPLFFITQFGTGFVGVYRRPQENDAQYVQIFNQSGAPVGGLKKVPGTESPIVNVLAGDRFVVLQQPLGKTLARVYSKTWQPLTPPKTLSTYLNTTGQHVVSILRDGVLTIKRTDTASGSSYSITRFGLDLDPVGNPFTFKTSSPITVNTSQLLDGGLLLLRSTDAGTAASHSILRLDSKMKQVGSVYGFAGIAGDRIRVQALSTTQAVAVFLRKVGGHYRLVGQRLKL